MTEAQTVFTVGNAARTEINGKTQTVILIRKKNNAQFEAIVYGTGEPTIVEVASLSPVSASAAKSLTAGGQGEAMADLHNRRYEAIKKFPTRLDRRDVTLSMVKGDGSELTKLLESVETKGFISPLYTETTEEKNPETIYYLSKAMNDTGFKNDFEKLLKKHSYALKEVTKTKRPRKSNTSDNAQNQNAPEVTA